MFIQTEATPNPATLKFLPGRAVLDAGTLDMPTARGAAQSPLAARLFDIAERQRRVLRLRLHHRHQDRRRMAAAQAGDPRRHHGALHVRRAAARERRRSRRRPTTSSSTPTDAETVATIKDLIETRVRPAVASDGGDITFRGYQGRRRLSAHEGRLLGLPVLDRDAASTASRTCCAISCRTWSKCGRCDAPAAVMPAIAGPVLRACVDCGIACDTGSPARG